MVLDISKNLPYIIAEIGHNHQGDLNIAFEMFKEAKHAGASAVKLQKRNNKKLYTKKFFNDQYNHENSYGNTYGEHREFLEFGESEYKELKSLAKDLKIDFFATPFDFYSLEFLEKLEMPAYKIASADLTNTPLQKEIAKTKKQIFLSTGGGTLEDVIRAKENICNYNQNLSILHCTASYPAQIQDMNLSVLNTYRKQFPNIILGLSDHENGIDAGPIAYMLGARVFEKHFTLDRAKKGTDHSFSLEPTGLSKFVRNVNRVEKMLGSSEKKLLENEKKPLYKMKKSIVTKYALKKGQILSEENVDFKSPGGGLEPYMFDKIKGKSINKDLEEEQLISMEDIK